MFVLNLQTVWNTAKWAIYPEVVTICPFWLKYFIKFVWYSSNCLGKDFDSLAGTVIPCRMLRNRSYIPWAPNCGYFTLIMLGPISIGFDAYESSRMQVIWTITMNLPCKHSFCCWYSFYYPLLILVWWNSKFPYEGCTVQSFGLCYTLSMPHTFEENFY